MHCQRAANKLPHSDDSQKGNGATNDKGIYD